MNQKPVCYLICLVSELAMQASFQHYGKSNTVSYWIFMADNQMSMLINNFLSYTFPLHCCFPLPPQPVSLQLQILGCPPTLSPKNFMLKHINLLSLPDRHTDNYTSGLFVCESWSSFKGEKTKCAYHITTQGLVV